MIVDFWFFNFPELALTIIFVKLIMSNSGIKTNFTILFQFSHMTTRGGKIMDLHRLIILFLLLTIRYISKL